MEITGRDSRLTGAHGFWQQWLLPTLGLVVVMLAMGLVNFQLHIQFAEMSAWLPAGLALGAVLLMGVRALPGVFLGAFFLMLSMTGEWDRALLYAFAVMAACQVVVLLLHLRRSCGSDIDRVGSVACLLLAGMVAFLVMSALLGPRHAILLQHHSHQQSMQEHGHRAEHSAAPHQAVTGHGHGEVAPLPSAGHGTPSRNEWLFSELLGMLFMTPALLWFCDARKKGVRLLDEQWRGALFVLLVLIAVTVSVYSGFLEQRFGLVHTTLLVLPPAVWLALGYGMGYTILGNLVVFFIVGLGTSLGFGPFKDHTSGLPLLTVVYCMTTLLIAASRSERMAAEATIHRLATKDALTGLPNRSLFTSHVERALYNARRYKKSLALMFIDLDYFKKVNDTLGHDIGDQLLVQAAERIQSSLRVDSMLARFGGDEFVALVDNVEDHDSLQLVAQRISTALVEPFNINGQECRISCSVGISFFPQDGDTLNDLLKRADIAMYEVKMTGRNGFKFYAPAMHQYLDGGR